MISNPLSKIAIVRLSRTTISEWMKVLLWKCYHPHIFLRFPQNLEVSSARLSRTTTSGWPNKKERQAFVFAVSLEGNSIHIIRLMLMATQWWWWLSRQRHEQQWSWQSAAHCRTQAKTWGSKRTTCSRHSPIGVSSIIIIIVIIIVIIKII